MKIKWRYVIVFIVLVGNLCFKKYKVSNFYLNSKFGPILNKLRIKEGILPVSEKLFMIDDNYFMDDLVYFKPIINEKESEIHFKKVCIIDNQILKREYDYSAYRSKEVIIDSVIKIRSTYLKSGVVETKKWSKDFNRELSNEELMNYR